MDEPFVIPVALFVCITIGIILRGPIGKALADRLAGRVASPRAERFPGEVEALGRRLDELEERLDFLERLVARQREAERLPGGG
ncbi:MAG TPA: hypothetical protein VNI61_10090 [Gemmatimonadales bacterium]|nr:hypothetical protein [Gemmatimonadales bacterium]